MSSDCFVEEGDLYVVFVDSNHFYMKVYLWLFNSRGEPDKADHFGNTALHLAAARGHKECVTFLANFGANLFSMDIDNHTPQELAAINDREDILRFLDAASAKMEINDK